MTTAKQIRDKSYELKLKRHKDTITALGSPFGETGGILQSASFDHSVRSTLFNSLGSHKQKEAEKSHIATNG
jgi:hypothetical protein